MCGIAGIVNFNNCKAVNENILKKMRDTMVHRGPDGAGIWISSDKRVGLAHRRLSIIDLSEEANQPMCNEDGTVCIVFNGEIYNYIELKQDLIAKGHKFRTDHSDTEVIIHAFEEWGKESVQRFRGMFAFAIWDDKTKELWFFRDRIGIKPFYYTIKNGIFLFASEIKAILASPVIKRNINEDAFYHYLSFLATPAPDTLFEGIKKLPCGYYGRLKDNGSIDIERYWDVWDHTIPQIGKGEQEIAEMLLSELRTAVKYRKVSDVPVGVFLSGGVDSSTNAVLFSEGETNAINTFSIGYDKEYEYFQSELEQAKIVAQSIRAKHHGKNISEDDLIEFLPKLAYQQDEPISDSSCIPTYYVSKLSKDNGITVCQVGEGSDELYCGYKNWIKFIKYQKFSNLPMSYILTRSGTAILKFIGQDHKKKYELIRRASMNEPVFWGGAEGFTEAQKKQILSQRMSKKYRYYSSYEVLKHIKDRFDHKAWDKTPLNWMTYLDLNIRLPELLLMRVDKMSMAVSLEARVPFLDHKLVELAMSIPESIKIRNGINKYILKRAVSGLVPMEVINREKQGFSDLLNEWLFEVYSEFVSKKIVDFTKRVDLLKTQSVEALLRSRRYTEMWLLLNFVLWHEKWIEERE